MCADWNTIHLEFTVLDLRADELVLVDEEEDFAYLDGLTVYRDTAPDKRGGVIRDGMRVGAQQHDEGDNEDPGRAIYTKHLVPPWGSQLNLRVSSQATEYFFDGRSAPEHHCSF